MVLARHVETCESLEEVGARNNAVIVENVLLLRHAGTSYNDCFI